MILNKIAKLREKDFGDIPASHVRTLICDEIEADAIAEEKERNNRYGTYKDFAINNGCHPGGPLYEYGEKVWQAAQKNMELAQQEGTRCTCWRCMGLKSEEKMNTGHEDSTPKAIIHVWCGEDGQHQKLKQIGYEHDQVISLDEVFKVSQKIFESGLNVMLYRNDTDIVIGVDTKRFRTRG